MRLLPNQFDTCETCKQSAINIDSHHRSAGIRPDSTYCYATLARQLLLGLFGWIRIAQVTVEILVQYLRRLFAEVASLAAGVEETRSQYHHRLAGRLLQLHLDGAELLVDDLDHALDFFGCDGPDERDGRMNAKAITNQVFCCLKIDY